MKPVGHKERVKIAKPPMSRLQWNALAIFAILGILPFATAVITNAGSSTDGLYDPSITMEQPSSSFRGVWYDNGADYQEYYETNVPMPAGWYNCVHIVEGECGDDYQYSTDQNKPLSSSTFDWILPTPSYIFEQTHQNELAPGEYLGTSGQGPFSFYLYGASIDGIVQNDTLDKIKYTFADYYTVYDCEYSGFEDLIIESDLTFIYGGNEKTFKDFSFKTTNKYQYLRYDNTAGEWSNDCVVGFDLEYDFTGFESLDLTSFNGGDWANTDHLIQLKRIVLEDAFSQNIGSTPLPFAGDGFFAFTVEHQSINTVQAGFIIKSLTSLLSVGTFALAAASTQYWDPFKNLFKGAV